MGFFFTRFTLLNRNDGCETITSEIIKMRNDSMKKKGFI